MVRSATAIFLLAGLGLAARTQHKLTAVAKEVVAEEVAAVAEEVVAKATEVQNDGVVVAGEVMGAVAVEAQNEENGAAEVEGSKATEVQNEEDFCCQPPVSACCGVSDGRRRYNHAYDAYNNAGYNSAGIYDAHYDAKYNYGAGYNSAGYNNAGYNSASSRTGYNGVPFDLTPWDLTTTTTPSIHVAQPGCVLQVSNSTATMRIPFIAGEWNFLSAPYLSNLAGDIAVGPADNHMGCVPFAEDYFKGKIAVVFRGGGCNFVVKGLNTQAAGALLTVIVNHKGSKVVYMTGGDSTLKVGGIMVDGDSGHKLRDDVLAGSALRGTLLGSTRCGPGPTARLKHTIEFKARHTNTFRNARKEKGLSKTKPKCNWKCYIALNPDLADYGDDEGKAEAHYNNYGFTEGRNCLCPDSPEARDKRRRDEKKAEKKARKAKHKERWDRFSRGY